MGYRTDDSGVEIKVRQVKDGCYAKHFPRHGFRAAVSTSMFGRVHGVVLFKPDLRDPYSSAEGFLARLGSFIPRATDQRFHEWAIARDRRIYEPVPADADLSVATWLSKTGWSRKTCEELLRESKDIERTYDEIVKYKAFNKDEWYVIFKFFRAIMGRCNAVKVLLGPCVRAVEEQVFCRGAFVKKIPIPQRPDYIRARFDLPPGEDELPGCVEGDDAIFAHNGEINESDIESLEAHFAAERQAREIAFFAWMLQYHRLQFTLVLWLCYKGQWAQARGLFNAFVRASRGSGDFQTSVANGKEIESACVYLTIRCAGRRITVEDWAAIGFKAKCDQAATMGELAFCGMTFSEHSNIVVRDPLPVLARLGWTPARYSQASPKVLWQLLRLRGYSLACEMGRCPVLWVLARQILVVTHSYRISPRLLDQFCDYDRQLYLQYSKMSSSQLMQLIGPPDAATRDFFASRYKIPLPMQLLVEDILSTWDLVYPISLPLDFPEEWRVHFDAYTMTSYETCESFGEELCADMKGKLPPRLKRNVDSVASLRMEKPDPPHRYFIPPLPHGVALDHLPKTITLVLNKMPNDCTAQSVQPECDVQSPSR